MLLLDTNVISELRKVHHQRTSPTFIAWSRTLRWSDLYLSAITIHELEIGVSSLERYDPMQGLILRSWLDQKVLEKFGSRILPINTEIALRSARLHLTRSRQVEDTLIAATAQAHRMKVVTRNVGDFEDAGVEVINPWAT